MSHLFSTVLLAQPTPLFLLPYSFIFIIAENNKPLIFVTSTQHKFIYERVTSEGLVTNY